MTFRTVGVVGLNDVGHAITAGLIKLGYDVVVFDARVEQVAFAVALGARAAVLPADVAEQAAIVVLAVRDEATAEEVLFDLGGIGETLVSGGVVLDATASGPAFCEQASLRLAKLGLRRIDVGRSVTDIIDGIAA